MTARSTALRSSRRLPGQRVRLHRLLGVARKRQAGRRCLRLKMRQVVMGEQQDVLRALAQRRQRQRDDVQAVEQVLAETARPHFGFEVAVGRGDQSNVGLPLARLAQPFVGAVVEEPQQTRLRVGRQLADLIEEQRAALGFLDLAGDVGDRRR